MNPPVPSSGGRLTVEALERWTRFGAHWRVLETGPRDVLVELCQCTGEPVERHRVDEPEVVEFLRTHPCDETP